MTTSWDFLRNLKPTYIGIWTLILIIDLIFWRVRGSSRDADTAFCRILSYLPTYRSEIILICQIYMVLHPPTHHYICFTLKKLSFFYKFNESFVTKKMTDVFYTFCWIYVFIYLFYRNKYFCIYLDNLLFVTVVIFYTFHQIKKTKTYPFARFIKIQKEENWIKVSVYIFYFIFLIFIHHFLSIVDKRTHGGYIKKLEKKIIVLLYCCVKSDYILNGHKYR